LDADQTSVINFEYRLGTTESSNNISKVLEHLKLGLNDETTPDSLMYKDIGESIGRGSMKIAFKIFWRFNAHFSKFVNPLNFVF
jgi:hypothetical protein